MIGDNLNIIFLRNSRIDGNPPCPVEGFGETSQFLDIIMTSTPTLEFSPGWPPCQAVHLPLFRAGSKPESGSTQSVSGAGDGQVTMTAQGLKGAHRLAKLSFLLCKVYQPWKEL